MKTAEEILNKNCKYIDLGIVPKEAISAMEEYADQSKPKWIPFEIWIETACPGAIVDTYSDVYLRQVECEYDGESIEIFGYDFYPGETKIWIMDIPEPPNT